MISILLLDEDREYVTLLAQRLAAAGREFSVTAGAPPMQAAPPAPETSAGEPRAEATYDFVILGESAAKANLARETGFGEARTVLLCESGDATLGGRGFLRAERFGRVSALAALLRAEHAALHGNGGFPQSLGGAVKYIGCFGLGGCCGASSVAIGLGRELAAHAGRRALYVSLETLEAESLCVRRAEGDRHIGDFMYLMLRKRDADLRMFLEACLFRDSHGLARFFPSPGPNDLARASLEERGDFFRFIDACGAFDAVVLDLGSECNDLALGAAQLCDALILVENAGVADAGKRARAAALLRAAWRRDGGENPLRVKNLARFSYGADEEEAAEAVREAVAAKPASEEEEAMIEIGYDSASFRRFDGVTDFVLSNEFGLGIRKLAAALPARVFE
ncbi:MAG: hypothetical protein LBP30_06285 [Clostridiales Family XIII bacterium]|nr:hypothetical protein [Clostridiales Family XIII bacterium]